MEETVTNKGIIGILLAIVIMIGTIAGAVSPKEIAHAAEDYRTWSQKDERWAYTAMGGSTVKESGCYITSIAMVTAASGARNTESFNPGVFAQQLNNIGAFSRDGSLMYWASVNAVIPEVKIETANLYFSSGSRADKVSEMKSWLDKGMYVICNVGGHWVYVDNISGADITMADPAKTETDLFSAYSDVYCYQVLSGKNPYGSSAANETAETTTAASSETTTTTTTVTTKTTTSTTTNTTTSTTTNAVISVTVSSSLRTAFVNVPLSVIEKSMTEKSDEDQTTTEATPSVETTTTETTANETETTTVTETIPTGEYFFTGSETAAVYSEMDSTSNTVALLRNGDIINVTRIVGSFGCLSINGCDAWVEMSGLEYAGENEDLIAGDINGDGTADAVDLALLNDYIRSSSELPEGISTLRRCEVDAADINFDGIIDNNDVLMYLMLICE